MWPGFRDVFAHPNGFLFANSGDGLKNYFNLGFYLKYNSGLTFTGVNYPYGEHLFFIDSHPLYALLLNFIDNNLFAISHNSVALINLPMLAGMLFCPFMLYMILTHYKMPVWYSVVIALSITLLSPQWDRFHGHLSLSYAFVIPAFWYLLLKYETSKKSIWYILLFVFTFLIGGIHTYYLAICCAFLLGYMIVSFLKSSRDVMQETAARIKLGLIVVLPLLVYLIGMQVSDVVNDRPIAPYGFYTYHATWASVFLPHYSSITTFFGRFDLPINWEGRAFIGLPALFFVIGSLVSFFLSLRKKQTFSGIEIDPGLGRFALASFLVLLFSMCIPFEWGFRFLAEWIDPIKQFRALGRFSWVFFYVINIYAAVYLYLLIVRLTPNQPAIYTSGLTIICLIWAFDGAAFYINHGPVRIVKNDKLENHSSGYQSRFDEDAHRLEDFQAILSLPLVAVRTDKMTFQNDLSAHGEAMKCAFHTGLPLIQSSASRPSLGQTLTSIQLISSPMIQKRRLKDMNDKSLLVLHSKGSKLSPPERRLLEGSKMFWEDDFIELRSLPVPVFSNEINGLYEKSIALFDHLDDGNDGTYCHPSCDGVVQESFDGNTVATLFGSGAKYMATSPSVLIDTVLTGLDNDTLGFSASFWIYIDSSYSGMPRYEYFYGQTKDQFESAGKVETSNIPEIYGSWVNISFALKPVLHHKIVLHGQEVTVDELMIKSEKQTVLVVDRGKRSLNNYPVP